MESMVTSFSGRKVVAGTGWQNEDKSPDLCARTPRLSCAEEASLRLCLASLHTRDADRPHQRQRRD